MTSLKAVIFDKDGTLFDFSTTWEAWAAAFLRRIATSDVQADALGRRVGFDIHRQKFLQGSIAIAGTPMEVAQALAPLLPDLTTDALVAILNEEAASAPQAEVLPLPPFLDRLRGMALKLGVVTNDAETPARAHLAAANVADSFDFIAGFDSGFGAKPAPGQLLACARAMDIAPEHIVMVGDSTHDLIAAQRAGMRGVGVLTGLADYETLAPYADDVLPDISALPGWISSH
ncbi:HAD family hydrolase [Roseobacter denitrificans]|uniref:phosphoglycolate phosphatase n=1 Tax=Roseobacter denitrificans (strain ATCC 33942 / OCh 114) TaxID=375451 RepID=Q166K6_ROSDO|nr:HAD family hydrolase [Roseobacter denitrificans]ABG32087.1 haloacid dehalogenase-like hydrolase, putative [Roseobacter denitrificans OCh 114]SFF77161.1 phosphoglycolate phosphatase [Roseobacter denitrificans OCh 114]